MFEFIEDIKLKIRQDREIRNLHKAQEAEYKVLVDKKKYETDKETLDRDIELEKRKAKIRNEQSKSQPKPGQKVPEKKSAFGMFQDFATDFARRQNNGPSAVGSLNMGFGHQPSKPKQKHKHKRKKEKVKMVYVPMGSFGNKNIKTVRR